MRVQLKAVIPESLMPEPWFQPHTLTSGASREHLNAVVAAARCSVGCVLFTFKVVTSEIQSHVDLQCLLLLLYSRYRSEKVLEP